MGRDFLLYDGECPVCSAYVAMARLRRLYPDLEVLNARSEPGLVAELRRRGYEINEGMVLNLDGVVHFGADATRTIACLGGDDRSSWWRRAGLSLLAAAPYPWLSRGRLALLTLLRRRLID
jgi:predicted DCC family thiol-disulfide oxidoreductase YuxK